MAYVITNVFSGRKLEESGCSLAIQGTDFEKNQSQSIGLYPTSVHLDSSCDLDPGEQSELDDYHKSTDAYKARYDHNPHACSHSARNLNTDGASPIYRGTI